MARYVAKFLKNVISDTGHQVQVLQRTLDVDAPDRVEATRLAKKRFCELERVQRWSDHADALVLNEADFPS
jgi:hypothetical protein